LIGHVTKDLQPHHSFTIGGTVTYAAMTVKQLGGSPIIVTTAGPDFTPPSALADADWRILPADTTTTFRNEYTPQGRRQWAGPLARAIHPEEIPPDCRQAELIHLGPVAQEVAPEISTIFPPSTPIMATPQGWMRQWDETGRVFPCAWRAASALLPRMQVVIVSDEDIAGDWVLAAAWAAQIPILIVTQNAAGCTLFYQGQKRAIPSRQAEIVDPTGMGDIFAAAFLMRLAESGRPIEAAYFANVTASMALERPGLAGIPTRREVEEYCFLESFPG
jgi:sugar/nucleoside kinase (ribokinase family)